MAQVREAVQTGPSLLRMRLKEAAYTEPAGSRRDVSRRIWPERTVENETWSVGYGPAYSTGLYYRLGIDTPLCS